MRSPSTIDLSSDRVSQAQPRSRTPKDVPKQIDWSVILVTSSHSIRIPDQLKRLLANSKYEPGINAFVQKIGTILGANRLTFFPGYTDHGVNHINDVLVSITELIPNDVWGMTRSNSEQSLLSAADAAVIIAGTLLHDVAMFLQISGFQELIKQSGRHKPLRWFDKDQQGHSGDQPWWLLWTNYEREIRRFGTKKLTDIIGEEAAATWTYKGLPSQPGKWTENLRLIVGEFLRRHHARLAHEIAIYGFPGLSAGSRIDEFPALGDAGHELSELADLIGLTARSHGMCLRVCTAYLESEHSFRKDLRPNDCAVLYPMALLRVADYLQLDKPRAPAVLLQLIDPQSRVSVQEWANHKVVTRGTAGSDRTAIFLRVNENIALPTFLQIEALFAGLQRELDHSAAVLSENYGSASNTGLDQLRLTKSRIDTNLTDPTFRKRLPYIPQRTGFSVDPQLLPLLAGPLYGNKPRVAIRELMQNSLDAVRELESLYKDRTHDRNSLDLYPIDNGADVSFEFIEREHDKWILRVTDRGIGMRGDTLANYFLRAGATFRNSADWFNNFTDAQGRSKVTRTGRFGIGMFAIFLLGPTFEIWTRHSDDTPSDGFYLQATEDSALIEIKRMPGLQIGTKIEILLHEGTIRLLCGGDLSEVTSAHIAELLSWYCWPRPRIIISFTPACGTAIHIPPTPNWPLMTEPVDPRINVIEEEFCALLANHMDAVEHLPLTRNACRFPRQIAWTFSELGLPPLSLNGFHVTDDPYYRNYWNDIGWHRFTSFDRPYLSINDPDGLISTTITRDKLQNLESTLICATIADITLSVIAHAIVAGPSDLSEVGRHCKYHPAVQRPVEVHPVQYRSLCSLSGMFSRWVCSSRGIVPFDPHTIAALKYPYVRVYGIFSKSENGSRFLDRRHYGDPLALERFIPGISGLGTICFFHGQFSVADRQKPEIIDFSATMEIVLQMLSSGNSMQLSSLCMSLTNNQFAIARSQGLSFKGLGDGAGCQYVMVSGVENPSKANELAMLCQEWHSHILGCKINHADADAKREHAGLELFVFVADIVVAPQLSKETLFSRLWQATLGPEVIPFDPVAREAMVAKALRSPLLGPHVARWQRIIAAESCENS